METFHEVLGESSPSSLGHSTPEFLAEKFFPEYKTLYTGTTCDFELYYPFTHISLYSFIIDIISLIPEKDRKSVTYFTHYLSKSIHLPLIIQLQNVSIPEFGEIDINDHIQAPIFRIVQDIPPAERLFIIDTALRLITSAFTLHDFEQIIHVLKRIPTEQRVERTRQTLEHLSQARQSGLLTVNNIFNYTYEYLNMRTPQERGNIDITGQEALMSERNAIKEAFQNLLMSDTTREIMAQNLPQAGAENEIFRIHLKEIDPIIILLLKNPKLSPSDRFTLTNAFLSLSLLSDKEDSETLQTLRDISSHSKKMVDKLLGEKTTHHIPRHGISMPQNYKNYRLETLPNIRQFFCLSYTLLTALGPLNLDPHEYAKNWLIEQFYKHSRAWQAFQHSFQHGFYVNFETIEETLRFDSEKNKLTLYFVSHLKGESDDKYHKSQYAYLKGFIKSYITAYKEQLTPLLEALSMIMRGHNTNLNSLLEKNKPACAEGAYIGLIGILREINFSHGIVQRNIPHLAILPCANE
ncbi:MAG: hypothetical protein JSS34_07215 [Proteobacteria bacterium]|nr:hypothetical protein [Pseudomonadota bacterium]